MMLRRPKLARKHGKNTKIQDDNPGVCLKLWLYDIERMNGGLWL